jgi:hypothetical protein
MAGRLMIRPGCQRIYSSNVRLENVLEAVPMARTGDWLKDTMVMIRRANG